MELAKGVPVADRNPEELIESIDSCCLCGTKLKFQHQTDFVLWEVQEEGHCPACGIRNKVNKFVLQ